MNKSEHKRFIIDEVIEKEKFRNRAMCDQLERQLEKLPKGSLVIRDVGNRKYCYLRYRDGKKIITKYVGTGEKTDEIRAMIMERERIVSEIKELDLEYERIGKMEAMR